MNKVVRILPTVARILLGLVFFVFGLNGFLNFMPMPPPPPGKVGELMAGFAASGYMFPLIKATEVIGGALLLSGRFVPLALTLLAPVIVNILAFHLVLDRSGMGMTGTIVLLEVYLAWSYRDAFAPMLRAKVAPAGSAETPATTTGRSAATA